MNALFSKPPTSASATNAPVIWLMGGDDGGASLLNSLYYTNADGTMASSWAMEYDRRADRAMADGNG